MPRRLKVFRTAAGFHDAYVAAPSRAAALRAWGADRDLFARGVAEEVTDAVLTAEPLAHPGEVIRRSRGTAAEQLAAAPAVGRKKAAPRKKDGPGPSEPKTTARAPKPDRGDLDEAEAALATAEASAARVARDFDAREAALARERRAAERDAREATRRAERARDRAAAAYAAAMADWQG